jgi:hypothetical protein
MSRAGDLESWTMRRRTVWLAAVAAAFAASGGPATAIVPPRDCKTIKVKGKTYNVKTDQLSCDKARSYTRAFLANGVKPSGYRCERYRNSSLVFRCVKSRANPDKTFFAIKR